MRRSWQNAFTVFLVVCIGLALVGEPVSRAVPVVASVTGERVETEPGQERVSRAGADSDLDGATQEESDPELPPSLMSARVPEVQLGATAVYTPSGIPVEDLSPRHPLVNLNLNLPAQDPDATGQRLATVLREHNEKLESAAEAVAQLSPEIQALAAGLDNDPKLIYEYVHNNFDLVPSWGLVKSPRETYLAKTGNPFDQTALLVALLQAAGYEAEFVFGLVQIPLDQAMNWVGVTDAQVLPYVFWNGGIPAEVQDNVLRINHIWARVRIGGIWYPLDPSFKAYTYQAGLDLAAVLSYNQDAFLTAAQSGSIIEADYVSDINQTNIDAHLIQYANNLIDYLRENAPFAYLEQVIGGRKIVPETLDGYPTQLPYTVESSWGETSEMPDLWMYKLHIEVPGIDYEADLPDVAGDRITIFHEAATPADQAIIDAAGGIYNVYPAYQVDMMPVLRVNGDLVATGDPLSLGSTEPITVTVVTSILDSQGEPWTVDYAPQWLRVGAWYALPLMLQTVSYDQLRRHNWSLEENLASGLADDSEPVLGQSLYTIGLSYFNQVDASDRIDAQIAGVVQVPHISGMLMSQDLAVLEWELIGNEWQPMRLGMAAYTIDVRLNWCAVLSASGDTDRERGFMTASGNKGSAAEHATLEQLQDNPSLSTIQVLDIANNQGLRIYHITDSNVDAILSLLDYSSYTEDALRADVQAGYEVIVPEANITYNDWTGTGWISFHAPSGSAGYWLSGSLGGAPGEYGMHPIRRGGSPSQQDTVDPELLKGLLASGTMVGTYPQIRTSGVLPTQTDPVHIPSGAFFHHTLDLAFGVLGYPISFSRTYVSKRNLQDGPMGYGWTHSYNMRLVESSDWARGFGFRMATDAAAAIAEAFVGVDIASTDAGALPRQRVIIGSEASDWVLAEVTANVVTVTGPEGAHFEYLQLSDGTYQSHQTNNSTLVENPDSTYTVRTKSDSRFDFDSQGRVTALTDADGNRTTMAYSGAGNLIRVTDAVGRSIELSYSDGRLTQISDPVGRTFGYEYDVEGNMVRYTDAKGGKTSYTYDGEHRILSVTDPEDVTYVTNVYDDFGRVVGQTNGRGATVAILYGDVRSTIVDPMAYRTVYVFDCFRHLVGTQDALGYTTATSYDANGNVVSQTDGNGGISRYAYDARGNLTRFTDPMGNVTSYTYDAADNLVAITDASGQMTHFVYDSHHHLVGYTDALGQSGSFSYDAAGQLTRVTDRTGQAITFGYDALGNVTAITDPLSHITTMSYDTLGRVVSITDANGHTTQMAYDTGDNLTQLADGLGETWVYAYDGNGSLISVTDPGNHATQYSYDGQFNLVAVTDALGHVTLYTYDANDALISTTDANDHTTSYTRDALGRATLVTDPLGRTTQMAYDGEDNLVRTVKPDGTTVNASYNANNHLTQVNYPDGAASTYAYDAVGRIIGAASENWSVAYTYDVLGRITQADYAGWARSTRYTYDAEGRPLSVTILAGTSPVYQVHLSRDANGRLTTVTDALVSATATYSYDAVGNVTDVLYSNGASSHYAHDANNWVTGVENRAGNGSLLLALAYTYDSLGNPVQIMETTPSGSINRSYAYDARYQLIRESYPRYAVEYVYDAVGNRVRRSDPLGTTFYSYDAGDQLISQQINGQTTVFTYDANGNQTRRTDARGTTTYDYNAADDLVRATLPGGVVYTYNNDALGFRASASGPSGTYRYLYDGLQPVLVEANGPGGGVAYVYGEPLLAMSRELTSGAVAFYHGDALGSVRNLTDVLGGPLASHSYDAYGWPGRPAGAQEEYAPRFLGQWGVFSEATGPGQYRMGLRTYDANTGRFLTLDPYPAPLGQPLLAAPYVYALNNPLVELDPVGLRPKKGEPTVNKPALGGVICVVTGGCIVKGIVSAKILTVGTVLVGTAGLGLVAVGGWLIYQYWWVPKQDRPPSPRLPLISQPVRRLEKGIRRTLQTRITNQRNSPRLKSLEQVDLQVDDTLSAPDKVGESRREAQKFINPTGRGTDF